MVVKLSRIDHSKNLARFYEIDVQPGLFGDTSVTRHWGRIGANGVSKEYWYEADGAAEEMAAKLQRQKERRGYKALPSSDLLATVNVSATW